MKANKKELLLTSRVLSVGEMATMIAHELNQPIGSIANILRGLKARLQRDALTPEVGTEALDRATEQALYASGVIQRVRTPGSEHIEDQEIYRRASIDLGLDGDTDNS